MESVDARLREIAGRKGLEFFKIPAVPHLFVSVDEPLTHSRHAHSLNLAFDFIIQIFENAGKNAVWVFDRDFVVSKAREIEKSPGLIESDWNLWLAAEENATKVFERLEKSRITGVKEDYCGVLAANQAVWEFGILPEYFLVYCDEILKELNARHPALAKEVHSMVSPLEKSMVSLQQGDFLELCLAGQQKKLENLLEKFVRNYYWSRANYVATPELTNSAILEEIKKYLKEEGKKKISKELNHLKNYVPNLKKQQDSIKKRKLFGTEDLKRMKLIARMTLWQDRRKAISLKGTYWLNQILLKAASETGKDSLLLLFLLPNEFLDFLDGKQIDWSEIKKRTESCGLARFAWQQQLWLSEEQIDFVKKIIEKRSTPAATELSGLVASRGRVIGRARIISDPRKQKIENGEILITHMTRPEFVPLMKKAAAIVTDEGGITSHAAIVSREFGIPCIVGTRNATRAFKDGELIEVDAENGIVKKIAR